MGKKYLIFRSLEESTGGETLQGLIDDIDRRGLCEKVKMVLGGGGLRGYAAYSQGAILAENLVTDLAKEFGSVFDFAVVEVADALDCTATELGTLIDEVLLETSSA